jgi:transcriptional adapter 2-alpha
MTISIKKRKYPEPKEDYAVKTHCDSCSRELTLKLIFKCAECPDYDLCIDCFCQGKQSQEHLNSHKYRILETLDFPIYSIDWYADEELLLLEGLQAFGIGNWEQIAEYIGSKDKDEVYRHYLDVYVESTVSLEVKD